MKKAFLSGISIIFALQAIAQDPPADTTLGWKFPTIINISLSQTSFSNWASGGENSYAVNGLLLLNADYKSKMTLWENDLIFAYGLMKQGEKEVRKTDDKIEFSSKFGYKAINHWYYSGLLQFKTQFTDGYKYDDAAGTKSKLSTFMAPGYLNVSLGMNYAPSKVFSLFIGPLSGRSTFVFDDELSDAGAFGVEAGKNVRNEFGGTMKALLNKDIMKNVNLSSKLELFSNYIENPQNIDVDWQMLINMKINKYLSASINLHMIYDDDIKTTEDNQARGAKVQFKEVFGIGFNYVFNR
jgi:hypothetical protein